MFTGKFVIPTHILYTDICISDAVSTKSIYTYNIRPRTPPRWTSTSIDDREMSSVEMDICVNG
jgi:hypothetical protein